MKRLMSPQRAALAVVAIVAGAAFTLSYRALVAGAERQGGIPHAIAWLVPIAIDGLQVAAYLAVVARALRGESARRSAGPWLGVILAAGASIAGNIAAAPPTAPARLWAAVAPLALLCALRFLEAEYRLAAQRAQLAADPGARARAYWQSAELLEGRRLTARELGEAAGIPRETARDWLRRWRASQLPAPPADNHKPQTLAALEGEEMP